MCSGVPARYELARDLLRLDDMARITDTEGLERKRRQEIRRSEEDVRPEGREAERNEEVGPEGREMGRKEDMGVAGRGGEDLLEAVRAGLGPYVAAAGQTLTPEGQVRDDVLLCRLRDFICGASVKEGWRG